MPKVQEKIELNIKQAKEKLVASYAAEVNKCNSLTKAAKNLGMSRQLLWIRLKDYGYVSKLTYYKPGAKNA